MKNNHPVMVTLVSLGCPKNFVDTEVAAGSIFTTSLGITGDENEADMMLVNTCAFIDAARKDSFRAIEHGILWKKRKAGRKLVVAGCLVQWKKIDEVKHRYPEVDLWTHIDSVENMGKILADLWNKTKISPEEIPARPAYLYNDRTPRVQLTPAHYAYLKIADGCDNCCAYCSIPLLRGPLRSRTEKSVLAEAENLIGNGVRELIVIAQDTGGFRRDCGEKDALAKLLVKLEKLEGDFRYRIMYLHPAGVTDRLAGVLADSARLARCIEMPIQHISDRILLSMGRHAGEKATREAVRKIREDAKCAIRTTFLVGFPGETQEDFLLLRDFASEQRFARMGAFPYSPEEGTRAAVMPAQVPKRVAQARYRTLMEIQQKISLETNQALLGKEIRVMLDTDPVRRKAYARTELDAPEIDNGLVLAECPASLHAGDLVQAFVRKVSAYDMEAEVVVSK